MPALTHFIALEIGACLGIAVMAFLAAGRGE